jgi:hypothetical protein
MSRKKGRSFLSKLNGMKKPIKGKKERTNGSNKRSLKGSFSFKLYKQTQNNPQLLTSYRIYS